MAETLGSLCDKLTIVKLKQYHTEDLDRLQSLSMQEKNLKEEIDVYLETALRGDIPVDKLTFSANKVFKKEGNHVEDVHGAIGAVCSKLAEVNCELWHEQEKVYEFENVPADEKNVVVKKLAILNLRRNKCIDSIDKTLQEAIRKSKQSC